MYAEGSHDVRMQECNSTCSCAHVSIIYSNVGVSDMPQHNMAGSDDAMNCYVMLSKVQPQDGGGDCNGPCMNRRSGDSNSNDTNATNSSIFADDLFEVDWDVSTETLKIKVNSSISVGTTITLTFSKDDFPLT